nr:hypothetical protein [Burkholderia thailandensis]
MLSAEEYEALIAASAERDALRGELRLVTAQRDLAEEEGRPGFTNFSPKFI